MFKTPAGHRSLRLSHGLQIIGVARASRGAFVEFLSSADTMWRRRDFEEWLAGAYALVTSVTRQGLGWVRTSRAPELELENAQFIRALRSAHAGICRTLETAASPEHDFRFATRAIRQRFVVSAWDETGREGWVPVDVPGMRLLDRVKSLLAADYLTRPHDYRTLLKTCPVCHAFLFARCVCKVYEGDLPCATGPRSPSDSRVRLTASTERRVRPPLSSIVASASIEEPPGSRTGT
jgi:hypothetical protein